MMTPLWIAITLFMAGLVVGGIFMYEICHAEEDKGETDAEYMARQLKTDAEYMAWQSKTDAEYMTRQSKIYGNWCKERKKETAKKIMEGL